MKLTKITDKYQSNGYLEGADIGQFSCSICKEGSSWWLSISHDAKLIVLDEFRSRKAAISRLEDVEGILLNCDPDEARRMFGVRDNRPHFFAPGSIDNLDYAKA